MPNNKLKDKYDELFCQFKATLKYTSRSSDANNLEYVVEHLNDVIDFDELKRNICRKLNADSSAAVQEPKSCDALHRSNNAHWFLIEFKMGNIDNIKIYEIRGKVFESLLLLTEQLDETIHFTREHCTFILVYNNGRQKINSALNNLRNSKSTPLMDRLYCFKNLYFNDVCVYSPREFEREFVNKHFP